MIPTRDQALGVWETFSLPEEKRQHSRCVADLSLWFARKYQRVGTEVDTELLETAALLHDIDKAVKPEPGERHPDTGVRLLRDAGMAEVADVVLHHPLHAILFSDIAPKTTEQKLLYLSDKMVKQEIIGVDKRFHLWYAENLPKKAVSILTRAYPKVKALEREICDDIGIRPEELILLATTGK